MPMLAHLYLTPGYPTPPELIATVEVPDPAPQFVLHEDRLFRCLSQLTGHGNDHANYGEVEVWRTEALRDEVSCLH